MRAVANLLEVNDRPMEKSRHRPKQARVTMIRESAALFVDLL